MDNGEQYRSRSASESLSKLIAGIDKDIQKLFLELPEKKLTQVFLRYGEIYGVSKLIYAKNTYPRWKSKQTAMSGLVVARLLNLVPLVLDADVVCELVKKIRVTHVRPQHLDIRCFTTDWFRKLPPIIAGLVDYSNQFELPTKVMEKLTWLANGNGKAALELLAAAEVDEANIRTQYLNREYGRIIRVLAEPGFSHFNHTIELPQGTISVTIAPPPFNFFDRIPLLPKEQSKRKRVLSLMCKNAKCGSEIETNLKAYDGEPIDCGTAAMACPHCGSTYEYGTPDLRRTRKNLNVEIYQKLFGGYEIKYDCPLCGTRLISPLDHAGKSETCPRCKTEFAVPR